MADQSCSTQLHTREIDLSTPFVLVEYPNFPLSLIDLTLHPSRTNSYCDNVHKNLVLRQY